MNCADRWSGCKPAGSSVFAADADGGIVEIERSRRARMWRRQIHVNTRELPSGRSGSGEGEESKSMVIWGIR